MMEACGLICSDVSFAKPLFCVQTIQALKVTMTPGYVEGRSIAEFRSSRSQDALWPADRHLHFAGRSED